VHLSKELVLVAVCVAFLLGVRGQEEYLIDKYDVSSTLSGDTIHEKIVITLSGPSPPRDYVYLFAYPLKNIQVYDAQGSLSFSSEGEALIVELTPTPNVPYTFTIEFDTEGYVQRTGENRWVFSPTFSFDVQVRSFSLTVTVPSTAAFEAPIHPNPTSFFSTKDSLHLRWEKENLVPGEEVFIIVNFKRIASEGNNTYLWAFGALVLASLFFLAGFLSGKKKTRVHEIYFVGDEKIILDAIKEEGGKLIQSTLTKKTNFSKAKISKILSELEQKGIIQKDKYKRTNVIILKEPE